VVFHEVGHALGLAHNFKGSLSFKPDAAESAFTQSVMDYNQYNEEAAAFSSLDSSDGPLLEYDRQIISVLYNEGKDLKDTDPVLPACDDEEADSQEGGVDPLCSRYDIGADSTQQAMVAFELLRNEDARSGRMISLPRALARIPLRLPDATSITAMPEAVKAVNATAQAAIGVANLYVAGSANSLAYQGSQALRNLFVFRPGTLPAGYDENAMRERALTLLETAMAGSALPDATLGSFGSVRAAILSWLQLTPAFIALAETERTAKLAELDQALAAAFTNASNTMLARLRIRFADMLKYSASAPLSFHPRNGVALDLEAVVIGILESSCGPMAGSLARPITERIAAAKVLATYAKTGLARAARDHLLVNLTAEMAKVTDARRREELRKLVEALTW
jgi:hypothetical protein